MTPEEKLIIEQLLADCSPTVQSIVNAGNRFTIAPPCYDEESDEEYSEEEGNEESEVDSDKDLSHLTDKALVMQCINTSCTSNQQKPLSSVHQLSSTQLIVATPFDTQQDDGIEDTSLVNQPLPYDSYYVSIYHYCCIFIVYLPVLI